MVLTQVIIQGLLEVIKKEKDFFMRELSGECILVSMMEIHGLSFS